MRLLVGESQKAGLRVLRTRLVTEKAALDRLAGLEVSIVRRDREHDTQLEVLGVRLHKLRECRLLKIRLSNQHQRVVGVLLERHAHFNLHRGAPLCPSFLSSVFLNIRLPATWKTTTPSGFANPGATRDPFASKSARHSSTFVVSNGPRYSTGTSAQDAGSTPCFASGFAKPE